jgi:lipopolysaccharide export system protein LptC
VQRYSPHLTLFLLLLAAFSWWLSRDQAVPVRGNNPHTADYYTENMTSIEMDKEGLPARRLLAQRMLHYGDDDSIDLVKPQLTIFVKDQPPWTLRAQTGQLSGDQQDLWLRGQVYIDRETDRQVAAYHMVTSELHLRRHPDYAETDQPVHVLSDSAQVDAVGMQAWLKPEIRIKLLSKARGIYEQR